MNIPFPYDPNKRCPCLVGQKLAKDCCLISGNEWAKKPSYKPSESPISGFSNTKCYLSKTRDCHSEITREHFVSKTVLKFIGDGKAVKLSNAPWMKSGESKDFPLNALTIKALCDNHNSRFSPLDTEAGRLFGALREVDEQLGFSNRRKKIYIFCGEDLEKWLLKTLCNIFILYNETALEKIPQIWLDILHNKYDWPTGWGMYMFSNKNQESHHSRSLHIKSLNLNQEIVALNVYFYGLSFLLAVSEAYKPKEQYLIFRP